MCEGLDSLYMYMYIEGWTDITMKLCIAARGVQIMQAKF